MLKVKSQRIEEESLNKIKKLQVNRKSILQGYLQDYRKNKIFSNQSSPTNMNLFRKVSRTTTIMFGRLNLKNRFISRYIYPEII